MWCHSLLQGIFPTQGSNPVLLYCRQILYLIPLCIRKIRSNAQKSVRKSTTSPWRWGVNWVFFVKAAWWYFQLSLKMSIPFGPANVFIFIYSRKTHKCKWKWCMNAYYGTINNSENINLKQSDSPSVKQWLWDIMQCLKRMRWICVCMWQKHQEISLCDQTFL